MTVDVRTVPRATYRLQFSRAFTFRDAARLVPYLASLGISHVYASPWLKARASSTHGYDITDHNAINPEVGTQEDFEALIEILARHGMGQILDFVPNHMGIGQADNAWWLDMLEWGPASPYAAYFDIDWTPVKVEMRGKVLLPFLGTAYGEALEKGELRLAFDADAGRFSIFYHEHRFPVRPRRYGFIMARRLAALAKERGSGDALVDAVEYFVAEFGKLRVTGVSHRRGNKLRVRGQALQRELAARVRTEPALAKYIDAAVAEINGRTDDPRSFASLHRLLEAQSYRLANWRSAADEINYRRFFDINDLAGLRVELPELFEATHRFIFRLIGEGKIHGLRIDHIDGLFDPGAYCERLQARTRAVLGDGREKPLYVVVEKILAQHERLRESWPVAGTTGYEFANTVAGFLVNARGERVLDRLYRRLTGREESFDEVVYAAKRQIIETALASELQVLANELNRISEANWRTRDFTQNALRSALKEVVACFPVYRTYVDAKGPTAEDRRDIDWALAQARKRSPLPDPGIFDFIQRVLTLDLVRDGSRVFNRREVTRFAMKFQQYTGPVMAKSLEDTSFYRYARLLALNEVGGDPRRFGISVAALHHANQERSRRWPHAMLATATHDTKRGEDTRARLAALSEIGDEWGRKVRRWALFNRLKRREIDGRPAPGRNDEYLLYQTLAGAWPVEVETTADPRIGEFAERVRAYMVKAAREAKTRTSWAKPNPDYEAALEQFVMRVIDPAASGPFLQDFLSFHERLARLGMLNGLVQVALKLTSPGVPDIYQGSELWDLTLVDPDNRRLPDYERRAQWLDEARAVDALDPDRFAKQVRQWRDGWRDARVKMHVVRRLLRLRAKRPELFADGDYAPIEITGTEANRAVAFTRRREKDQATLVAGRHFAPVLPPGATIPPAEIWGNTALAWPGADNPPLKDVLTGRIVRPTGEAVPLARLLDVLPVAVLVPEIQTA